MPRLALLRPGNGEDASLQVKILPPETEELALAKARLQAHRHPLPIRVGRQRLHQSCFLIVALVTDTAAGLTEHLESRHGISADLAVPDRHVVDVLASRLWRGGPPPAESATRAGRAEQEEADPDRDQGTDHDAVPAAPAGIRHPEVGLEGSGTGHTRWGSAGRGP
jgi:hypothetical protein